ncbi:MAG: amidohydrolase family protein [Candidatus Heimdallarchaeaceae archaeon]
MDFAVRGRLAIYFDNKFKLHFVKDPLILIEENKIIAIDSFSKLKKDLAAHDLVGDENQLLIPGLINCHTHLAMTIFRGLADNLPLKVWLEEYIWPLEKHLKSTDVYYGSKLAIIESLLSGSTTVNSMYWFPSDEARAIKELGLRGYVAAPLLTGITTLDEAKRIIEKLHDTSEGRIRATLSLHAPYTVTTSEFIKSSDYINEFNIKNPSKPELLMHTHLAESSTELEQSRVFNQEHGEEFPETNSPVDLFDKLGVLNTHMIAAHCINVNRKDIKILKEKEVGIALNPLSNAKLGNNLPPLPEIISLCSYVGLGTDGAASNNTLSIFDTIRFLSLYYKGAYNDPSIIKAQEVFRLATIGGAFALRWKGIGTLEPNSFADVVTINLKKTHLTPNTLDDAILNHFVYSMNGGDVENVIANGKLVVQNKQFLRADVDETMQKVEIISQRLLSSKE